jgi:nitrite reductase/ring-hydroxylating ferredoxin subunit
VRKDGQVAGFVDRCPHQGFPIAMELDRYLIPDGSLILCGWHGAVFEPLSGECVGGPCAGARLTPWPVAASGGMIRTV